MNRSAIRASALQWRREVLGQEPDRLAPALEIVRCAVEATGIGITTLPHGDPLLGKALAVLDREAETIWIDEALRGSERCFTLAHEFAHIALHSACSGDIGPDSDLLGMREGYSDQTAEGYSPRQRREVDANIWGAELLMPEAMLRPAYFEQQLGAREIAARLGLSSAVVCAQMRAVLLRPRRLAASTPQVRSEDPARTSEVGLDPSQEAAAKVDRGPFLLAAGPGTGKTRTLVARCVHLARERGVAPESILALTFSRKAAMEMRERLITDGVGTAASGPWVGTFHAFCLETLRRYGDRIGLRDGWRLASEGEASRLLERSLVRLKRVGFAKALTPTVPLRSILKAISRAKDELRTPERYQQLVEEHIQDCDDAPDSGEALRLHEVARVYTLYQRILQDERRLDYGDLLMRSVELLERHPDVRRQLAAQYPHIVTDEYQDVNHASARLIKLLAGEDAAGLWAVGDRRQSIYRFRGASPANVTKFEKDYPGSKYGELRVNYRSLPSIVRVFESAAERLSAAEPERFRGWNSSRTLDSKRFAPSVSHSVAFDEKAQAHGMAAQMRRLCREGVGYSRQTVLCRTHAQALRMAGLLADANIPLLYVGDLLERSEVKDLLCLLDLFVNEGATGAGSLLRVGRALGCVRDLEGVVAWARGLPPGGQPLALEIIADRRLQEGEPELAAILTALRADGSAAGILDQILFDGPALLRRLTVESEKSPSELAVKLLAVRRLLELAVDHQRIYERDRVTPEEAGAEQESVQDRVTSFMREIRRHGLAGERITTRVDDEDDEIDAVRIMTIHAAKGLEFRAVFLPNLSNGKFPMRDRATGLRDPRGLTEDRLDAGMDQEEEACLFFVALSRARDFLFMSRAERYGDQARVHEASPLLHLIAEGLKDIGVKLTRWEASNSPVSKIEREVLNSDTRRPKPDFDALSLDLYRRCPRQYYYRHVLGLSSLAANAPLDRYNECVRTAVDWLRSEWRDGRMPSQAVKERRVRDFWGMSGKDRLDSVDLYDVLYVDQAIEVVSQVCIDTHAPNSDALETLRYEPGRRGKQDEAVSGILSAQFDPKPLGTTTCLTCPYRIVCPE